MSVNIDLNVIAKKMYSVINKLKKSMFKKVIIIELGMKFMVFAMMGKII